MCLVMSFFFNDTATTEIYTLSLHDALPIYRRGRDGRRGEGAGRGPARPVGCPAHLRAQRRRPVLRPGVRGGPGSPVPTRTLARSEEHTSELQSRQYLVCRLLLEKKKNHFTISQEASLPVHLSSRRHTSPAPRESPSTNPPSMPRETGPSRRPAEPFSRRFPTSVP